ncbi:hypothetical protein [Streptomyces adustus]
MSVRRWGTGVGAAAVLVATGSWVMTRPADIDTRLWDEVGPVIEARLVAQSQGSGYGESVPELEARWFCRARALEMERSGDRIKAGVDTLCREYGVRDGALVECSGSHVPQVVRLEREPDGGYRVLSQEEPPDGAGYGEWAAAHFGFAARSALGGDGRPSALEAAARRHFGLPDDTRVEDC